MTVLFFMVVVLKILPEQSVTLSRATVLFSSIMVVVGSLVVLGLVSIIASMIGHRISKHALRSISIITGIVFIGVGLYLFGHMVLSLLNGERSLSSFF